MGKHSEFSLETRVRGERKINLNGISFENKSETTTSKQHSAPQDLKELPQSSQDIAGHFHA